MLSNAKHLAVDSATYFAGSLLFPSASDLKVNYRQDDIAELNFNSQFKRNNVPLG